QLGADDAEARVRRSQNHVSISVRALSDARQQTGSVMHPIRAIARGRAIVPLLAAACGPSPQPDSISPSTAATQFILDASGSMHEPVGDVAKMDAAHDALHSLVGILPDDPNLNVGLRAYSHRSAGADKATSCQDSDLLAPLNGVDKDRLDAKIDNIAAVGE